MRIWRVMDDEATGAGAEAEDAEDTDDEGR